MILLYLACLFPLAVYLLILAALNRGPQPAVVAGVWDFAGVLLGVSGFLLFGGPMVLSGLYEQARLAALVEPSRLSAVASLLRPLGQLPWEFWFALWFLYFLVVAVGAACLFWRRQDTLAIYNITSDDFALVLSHVLKLLDMEGRQERGRVLARPAGTGQEEEVARLSAWPALRHVTLRWRGESPLRRQLEGELTRTLAEFDSGAGPLSGWLLGLAGGFFISLFFALVTYLFVLVRTLTR